MRLFLRFRGAVVMLALATASGTMEQSAIPAAAPPQIGYLPPTALAATKDGRTLFNVCTTANRILPADARKRAPAPHGTTGVPPTVAPYPATSGRSFISSRLPASSRHGSGSSGRATTILPVPQPSTVSQPPDPNPLLKIRQQ
jgi:hypothetical protein